jgi:hypothetical protein
MIGLEREDVMESWRKLSKENLDTSLISPDFRGMITQRRIRWVIYGGKGGVHKKSSGERTTCKT